MWVNVRIKPDRTDNISGSIRPGIFDIRCKNTAMPLKIRTSVSRTSSKWAILTEIQQPKIKASVLKYNM